MTRDTQPLSRVEMLGMATKIIVAGIYALMRTLPSPVRTDSRDGLRALTILRAGQWLIRQTGQALEEEGRWG